MSEKYKVRHQGLPHFVTLTAVHWLDVFIRHEYRQAFLDSALFCQQHKGLRVHAWVLMTSHAHLVVSLTEQALAQGLKLDQVIRDMKKFTSVQIRRAIEEHPGESRREWMLGLMAQAGQATGKHHRFAFWQEGFHPIELYSPAVYRQKVDYIHFNPVEAGFVEDAWSWRYSSAVDYFTRRNGLLPIVRLD